MHGLPRSKVFCSGYAVPGATFRRRPFINRKTSKIKRRFLVSFFVVKNFLKFFGKAAILGVQNEAFCAMSEGVNS